MTAPKLPRRIRDRMARMIDADPIAGLRCALAYAAREAMFQREIQSVIGWASRETASDCPHFLEQDRDSWQATAFARDKTIAALTKERNRLERRLGALLAVGNMLLEPEYYAEEAGGCLTNEDQWCNDCVWCDLRSALEDQEKGE